MESSLQQQISRAFDSMPANPQSLACKCGVRLENNCAHYVSNYLIEAGVSSLYNKGAYTNCKQGRPIRAYDIYNWATTYGDPETTLTPEVVYICYQAKNKS
ncbi:hypothetical protein FGO68_gene12145 [Halteria grandinella]|uniref:Uncharacterized protein n=1 Tax=Halteria grandinella TaxID=5974 RepID=A0A8J8NIN9_HALGN|nr:hypothetical protein FGO68_gene12145 [Halteria grandinella]